MHYQTLIRPPLVGAILIALALVSLSGSHAWAEKLEIITTTTDLAAITHEVAGEHAHVFSLSSGKEDPHFLQAKPSYIIKARDADLWIRIGMDLEMGWEPPILLGSRNPAIQVGRPGHLDASEQVLRLEVPQTKVSRDMGDLHPHGNPHYWLDPLNGRIMSQSITERLIQLAPEHDQDFKQNLTAFKLKLDQAMFGQALVGQISGARLWRLLLNGQLEKTLEDKGLSALLGGWLAHMKPVSGKQIIAYHRSWIYFTNRFNIRIAGELEPKPGIPPSPAHLNRTIEKIKANRIGAIVLEPYYSRRAPDLVASKTGAKAVVVPNSVGGHPEASSYIGLIDYVVKQITKNLQ